MKIDTAFFEQRWVKAIRAEFGAQGVLAVIRLFCSIYDSAEGYWREMTRMDKALLAGESGMEVDAMDRLLERLADYGVIDRQKLHTESVVTSELMQREFIGRVGKARARRLDWKRHALLTTEQLLELGVFPAVRGGDFDEPYDTPMPVYPNSPHLCPGHRLVRLRHPDPLTHIYRVVKERGSSHSRNKGSTMR